MNPRYQIELFMTVAFTLYLIVFFIARKAWKTHVGLALLGFAADMYATYLMIVMSGAVSFFLLPFRLQLHTVLAIIAILAFLVQAGLGIATKLAPQRSSRNRYFRAHGMFAKWFFLPLWVGAYLSGFALVV